MPRKIRIEDIHSKNFKVVIAMEIIDLVPTVGYYVRNAETCATTGTSFNMDDYKALKRVWRKSKENFDSACRFMNFNDLLSQAGVKLP